MISLCAEIRSLRDNKENTGGKIATHGYKTKIRLEKTFHRKKGEVWWNGNDDEEGKDGAAATDQSGPSFVLLIQC